MNEPENSGDLSTGDDTLPEPGSVCPYRSTTKGLIREKPVKDGVESVTLTNFTARIVEDVCEDDGLEERRYFVVEGLCNDESLKFTVPVERFSSLTWVLEFLGPEAVVFPGASEHTRTAIQLLSGKVPVTRVYTHTGWRQLGEWEVYLHGGGAIGPQGPVEGTRVKLPQDLQRFVLPLPPKGDHLRNAIRSSYRLLVIAPDLIVFPAFAAVYRAVLGSVDFSLHLVGETGQGKTTVAALLQQHYGKSMDARHLPTSWGSTANALEALTFIAKDALIVVDDLVFGGTPLDVQRAQREGGPHLSRTR